MLFFPLSLHAWGNSEKYAPLEVEKPHSSEQHIEVPPPPVTSDDHKILVSKITGLLILGSPDLATRYVREKIEGVVLRDLTPPGGSKEFIRYVAPLIIGKPFTKAALSELKRKIILYYRDHNRPVIIILVPEQDVTDGILQLVVVESKIGDISYKGQHYFTKRDIKSAFHLKKGHSIDLDRLLTDTAWLNQNPFRQTNIQFAPGKKLGTTDVDIVTKDRFPARVYAGVDNTGEPLTGMSRWIAGFNLGNAFNLGDLLGFQWTTTEHMHRFKAYSGNYSAPLPWRHTLTVYGGYSEVIPRIIKFKNRGWSSQASLRYKIPIGKIYRKLLQNVSFGYDFKEMNSNLTFADVAEKPIHSKVVRLGQFTANYNLNYLPKNHAVHFDLDFFLSPAKHWFPNQTKRAYITLQKDASPIYAYACVTLSDTYTFSSDGWKIFFQGRGQYSNKILLASEQFALGGYNTVRGYVERIVSYDNAICLNLELKTPSGSLWKLFTKRSIGDGLCAIGFIDYGNGRPHANEKPFTPQLDTYSQSLVGVGPGLRYTIPPYFNVRFDLGFPLTHVTINGHGPRIHFGLVATY